MQPIDNNGNVLTSDTIERLKTNGMEFPATADIEIDLQGDNLSVRWTTPIQTNGIATATKTRGGQPSDLEPLPVRSWAGFKKYVNALDRKRYIFRGQENSAWRLRTSFYRTGRANLEKYLINDIADLQKVLSAITQHPFDLRDPIQYGAFLNLAQHHGYPTPMLDWTWSPYVAAFFAFRNIRMNTKIGKNNKIRIFKFDSLEWNKLSRYDKFFPIWPNVSLFDALAFGNIRAIPKQSISTITNVDDIETQINQVENICGKKYLEVIELPSTERHHCVNGCYCGLFIPRTRWGM